MYDTYTMFHFSTSLRYSFIFTDVYKYNKTVQINRLYETKINSKR